MRDSVAGFRSRSSLVLLAMVDALSPRRTKTVSLRTRTVRTLRHAGMTESCGMTDLNDARSRDRDHSIGAKALREPVCPTPSTCLPPPGRQTHGSGEG